MELAGYGETSKAENKCLLVVVDKIGKFRFVYPLPTKDDIGVARGDLSTAQRCGGRVHGGSGTFSRAGNG